MSGGQPRASRPGRLLTDLVDLYAVVALVALTNLVAVNPAIDGLVGRAVLGIVFVLFLPGYALVAALFPETGRALTATESGASIRTRRRDWDERDIDGVERAALAFALSLAVVPLLVIGVRLSPVTLSVAPTIVTVSAFTVLCAAVAAMRRVVTSPADRFRVPIRRYLSGGIAAITDADRRADAVVNVTLAAAVLLAVGTLVFAVVAPPDGEQYTQFNVLTENDTGELTAAGYPDTLSSNEPTQLHVGIENQEERTVTYSVVVQVQRVDGSANESIVTSRTELDRFTTTLGPNESTIEPRNLTVDDELSGEGRRLAFLLYEDSVPDRPTDVTATQRLHVWVDAGGGDGSATPAGAEVG